MSLKKIMRGVPSTILPAEGYFDHDPDALSPCQQECATRLGMTVQLEQEAYLSQHPEIKVLLNNFISNMVHSNKVIGSMNEAAHYFTRPIEALNTEVRETLGIRQPPYIKPNGPPFTYVDKDLELDLKSLISKHYPPPMKIIPSPKTATPNTESSSFLSIRTSETTIPTPEPIPIPDPTLSEVLFGLISNTVDKAIFLHVDDNALRYDTAYVELAKAVEEAMEIPVFEIKQDIARLFYNAYSHFEVNIMEKERIVAEIAWERRMRKKLKRSLRQAYNFKGYETPPTPSSSPSEVSSHESYKTPPPRPCVCAPQFKYNRYPKDRFGIYLPGEETFADNNVTVTPAILSDDDDDVEEKKSMDSKKSQKNIAIKKVKIEEL